MGAAEEPPPATPSDPFQGLCVPTGCNLLRCCHARCVLMKRAAAAVAAALQATLICLSRINQRAPTCTEEERRQEVERGEDRKEADK